MQLDLDATQVALGNTTNKLLALQHSQFVESRVYDDDETIANVQHVPTGDTTNGSKAKETTIEALEFALKSGLNMMEKCFDKVTLDLDDSDDDDDEGACKR